MASEKVTNREFSQICNDIAQMAIRNGGSATILIENALGACSSSKLSPVLRLGRGD